MERALFSLQEEGNNALLSWLQTDFLRKSPWSPEVSQTRRGSVPLLVKAFDLMLRCLYDKEMKELTWGESRARIWLNELPRWEYPATRVAERRLRASGLREDASTCLAVEMAVHTGPMIQYGALGATFLPERRDDLLVRVLVSAEPGQRFPVPLASPSETARIGLPEEYIQSVLEDLAQFEELSALGTGVLSFERALYGEVGSSKRFFRRISHAVVRLLCLKQAMLSDEEYVALLRQRF